eukprot:m.140210 g.140210  ORF g.140210 m.140210 type:complete len:60 (-) comp16106_c0_seq2:1156-1335(-)
MWHPAGPARQTSTVSQITDQIRLDYKVSYPNLEVPARETRVHLEVSCMYNCESSGHGSI